MGILVERCGWYPIVVLANSISERVSHGSGQEI